MEEKENVSVYKNNSITHSIYEYGLKCFKEISECPQVVISDYFGSLINQVDLFAETAHEEINKRRQIFLDKLNDLKIDCMKKFDQENEFKQLFNDRFKKHLEIQTNIKKVTEIDLNDLLLDLYKAKNILFNERTIVFQFEYEQFMEKKFAELNIIDGYFNPTDLGSLK